MRTLLFLAVNVLFGVMFSQAFDLTVQVELILCLMCCAVSGVVLGLFNWIHILKETTLHKERKTENPQVQPPHP